jgi:hypothetical protein
MSNRIWVAQLTVNSFNLHGWCWCYVGADDMPCSAWSTPFPSRQAAFENAQQAEVVA